MNKIRFLLSVLGFLIGSITLSAQSIEGKVVDGTTNEPLPGATVLVAGKTAGVVADIKGEFSLDAEVLPVDLIISYIGYETISMRVQKRNTPLVAKLTPFVQQLDEVVVTAFERERRLIETPATVARLTATDLERFDLRSPQQAFSTLPGMKVESTTIGRYRIRIRGGNLGIVGHSDSYKMYWNSIPITLADGFPPLAYIDMGTIGTLDVIRGPSGSIYGAGLAGVALFENKKASYDRPRLEVDGLVGSYDTYRYGVSFATGGEKGDLRLQYTRLETGGYREEAASNNEFVNVFGSIFPSDAQTLSFMGIFGNREYGIPGNISAGAVEQDPRQANFSRDLDNGVVGRNLMIGIGHEYRWDQRWTNNTSINYQVLEGSFLIGNEFFTDSDQNTTTSFALRNATGYAFNLFGRPANFVLGFEYTRGLGDVDEFTDGFNSPIFSSRETINELMLGFVQAEFGLPGDVQMTIGGSYNHFRIDFQEFLDLTGQDNFERNVQDFSPRLALVKPIRSNLVVHGNISRGFAPPPRSAFDLSNQVTAVNEDLQSTTGWNKELGIRGTVLDDRLSLDLVFYRLDENEVIVPRVIDTGEGIDLTQYENAGEITRQGVELALQYQLIRQGKGFLRSARWWGNYAFMDHQFEEYNTLDDENNQVNYDGNDVPGIHPHSAVSGLDVKSKIGLYLFTTYNFYDKIYLNNENDASDDAYQLLDLKLGWESQFADRLQMNVYGGINNILDDEYSQMHSLNASSGRFFDPAMDRNYYAGIKVNYLF
ncbi:MAG: TonB-dependent receptor [Cytophagales bacterium]|nr:TonB-dependent receptor [Cytophagales bacterium]